MPEPTLTDESPMPYGKYGPGGNDRRKMKDVPASYLLWMRDHWQTSRIDYSRMSNDQKGVFNYIEENEKVLLDECPDHVESSRDG